MKWKPPKLDRGADQWSDREIEFEQMRANWAKVEAENSFLRRYAPIIFSAVISVVIAAATIVVDQRSAERAQAIQDQRWENERASNALRLFFENPDLFVGEYGAQNLDLLKQTTPEATMEAITSAVNERADRARLTASQEAEAVVSSAVQGADGATAAAVLARAPELRRKADDRRYDAIERSPSRTLTAPSSRPSDFTVYLQYGAGSQESATRMQSGLVSAGYKVPGIDAELTAPQTPEVRYYLRSQAEAARQLAAQVERLAGRAPALQFVGTSRSLPDGILEVWLPGSLDRGGEIRTGLTAQQFEFYGALVAETAGDATLDVESVWSHRGRTGTIRYAASTDGCRNFSLKEPGHVPVAGVACPASGGAFELKSVRSNISGTVR